MRSFFLLLSFLCLFVSGFNTTSVFAASEESSTRVQQLYVAYYGRPGDPEGVEYWANRLDSNSGNMDAITDQFGNSDEFTDRFGDLGNEELVTNLYEQMFNRTPDSDSAGFLYWLDQLSQVSLATVATRIADGAQNEDEQTLTNKVIIAVAITLTILEEEKTFTAAEIPPLRAAISNVSASTQTSSYDTGSVVAGLPDDNSPGENTDTPDLDPNNGEQVTGQKSFGIEYSIIENPTYHNDGVNTVNFTEGIQFLGGLHKYHVPTYDGLYIMYMEKDKLDAYNSFRGGRAPEEIMGESYPWYIAKIPYEPESGCIDWCYDRKFNGRFFNMNANMINDSEFSADLLYLDTEDVRFYHHFLESGFESDLPAFFDQNGSFVPFDPDNYDDDYPQFYPYRVAHTWKGVTATYVENDDGGGYSKTPTGWIEVDSVDENGNTIDDYGVYQFVGGQEVMFAESDEWDKGVQKESLHKLVYEHVIDTFKAWTYCENCSIRYYYPIENDEVIVVLEGYEFEDNPETYFTQVVRIFIGDSSSDTELLHEASFNDDESSGISVAVSPSWIFMSDGTAINRSSKERFYWLGTPDANDPIQTRLDYQLTLGIGLYGASDSVVLVYGVLNDVAGEDSFVRITPNFSN